MGMRVLFMDSDPQGNLSSILGYRHKKNQPTLYTAIKEFTTSFTTALPIYTMPSGVHLVPASMVLNRANDELSGVMKKEYVFQRLLKTVEDSYDAILIDSLPYLGVLVNNALVAAHEVIIPVHAEPLGLSSAAILLQHLEVAAKLGLVDSLMVAGGLLTMIDTRTALHTQMAQLARIELGMYMRFFDTQVERSIQFPESQFYRQPIAKYNQKGKGTLAYRALAREVLSGKFRVPIKHLHVPEDFADTLLELAEEQAPEPTDQTEGTQTHA